MSSFTKPLIVKVLNDGKHYEVQKKFEYYLENSKEVIVTIPESFTTDFASIPRIFWSIFPPFGKYTKAAVLHDFLCEAYLSKAKWNEISTSKDPRVVKRKEADKIFLEAMTVTNVNKFTRNTLYFFVRAYAWFKYGKSS